MEKITEKILSGKLLVSDGAWGTFLQAKGLNGGECPELWNVDHPDKVLEIAKSYINGGADMIETNSFGGSRLKLKSYGLENRTYELNKAAAEISRKAAGENKYVLGSIGPSGKMLMMGEVTEDELYEVYKEQSVALADGGADVIIIETFTDIQEATLAVKAAKENTSCEVICNMTFDKTPEGKYFTMMGISPEEMTTSLLKTGADIVGANCGNGMENMVGIVKEIRMANPDVPIMIQANAGMPIYQDGRTVFPETPEETAAYIPELIIAGANIIGGCCGTTPDHIRRICDKIRG
ncbi:homocysteine S-methyltransferase family protein [Desulfosarcina sp.]|nr:homocysteine S-methyltransferase family protein [Desulfosarcina sp.]